MGKNKDGDDRPRIKWGSLTIASTVEIEQKLIDMRAWGSSEDADNM